MSYKNTLKPMMKKHINEGENEDIPCLWGAIDEKPKKKLF